MTLAVGDEEIAAKFKNHQKPTIHPEDKKRQTKDDAGTIIPLTVDL